ncbi:MAG: methyltransferase domain-containing protein [Bacilli bacterium]|nr:methyltransferase domain-containing protein [Bacilli bacterium]MDD7314201.1 methyltransferase domain-containing protein [Bacilli bacterium]MDY4052762.1 methyltransferase domain-containing protein [Bacilli bacterium]
MSIKKDYLPKHPNIPIYQDDEMFCINTDTMVLGEFLNIYKNDVVLDMGTNNGALLIYASLFNPKKLIGLEINEKALELAERNLKENNISNYELINDNIITYRGEEVDVIICNPPYFKTKKEDLCLNKYKALAKHEAELTLDKLILSIRRNLKNYGTLYFLYLSSRLDEVLDELRKNCFRVKIIKFVFDENKEYSNVVLIKAVKGGKYGMVVEKPIIINRQ